MPPASDDEFNYASLTNRWRRERGTTALTRMDEGFYEAFDKHLRTLREQYEKEHAVNPATPKVLILQDELRKLQEVREDLYDLRERKLLTLALTAARGGNPDRANLTNEEERLFDEVVRVLRDARRNLLRRGAPAKEAPKPAGGPPTPPDPVPETPRQPARAAAADEGDRAPPAQATPETPLPGAPETPARHVPEPEQVEAKDDEEPRRLGPARVLVRVREDVDAFVGTDLREYHLHAEDVAAVPKDIAHALIQRGVAVAVTG